MQNSMSIDVQPRLRTRGFKSLLLAALGVVAICGCLLHTGTRRGDDAHRKRFRAFSFFASSTGKANTIDALQEQFYACGGVLSAPVTASSVASEYVPSALEQQTAEEIRDLLHKAQVIMQDPAKVKLLSQRIQQVRQEIGPMRTLRSKRVLLALNVLRAQIRSN